MVEKKFEKGVGVSGQTMLKVSPVLFKRDRSSWDRAERGGKSRKRRCADRNTETLVVFQDEKIKGLGENIRRSVSARILSAA